MIFRLINITFFNFLIFFLIPTYSMGVLIVKKKELTQANIIEKYNHNPSTFTQGLVYQIGIFLKAQEVGVLPKSKKLTKILVKLQILTNYCLNILVKV